MKAHFFDIDTLITVDNKVWIVSKSNPSEPIMKISKSEFNIIKKGVYKKYESPLDINGVKYWLPDKLYNNIKIKCKKIKCDITNLSFSLQEFMNASIVDELDYEIKDLNYKHLKNKTDDIYIICSRRNKQTYESIIKKLEDKLEKEGLKVKNYYFISETFYNRDKDDISYKKIKLLLQHLIGYKTEDDSFINEELVTYDKIYFYDDDLRSIKLALKCNVVFKNIIDNTNDEIKKDIKSNFTTSKKVIVVNQITSNDINPFISKEIDLEWYNIITTFENFKYK